MAQRQPTGPAPDPVVQRLRIRYAKRGRLRFTSHRDFARALERAVRRAELPIAFSAGFHPHPKISYVGAAPTGVASEAEYLEIALRDARDPDEVRRRLDESLPPGLDVLECVVAGPGGLPERITGSRWQVELPGADPQAVAAALALFLATAEVPVERKTKDGTRTLDARGPVLRATAGEKDGCAILDLVVRHATPAVRPDDVLAGLRAVTALDLPSPPAATRLAQGLLDDEGHLADPLEADVAAARAAAPE